MVELQRQEDVVLRALMLSSDRELVARLRETLFAVGGVELLGSVANAQELLAWGRRQRPDLVFLDADRLGVETDTVTASWRAERSDAVLVAVTARPELSPADIRTLVRPPDPESTRRLVGGLHLDVRREIGRARRAAAGERPADRFVRRLLVRSPGHVRLLPVEQILWMDAIHNAVKINTADGVYRVRQSIAALLAELDPAMFVRIHRSTVVQLAAAKEFRVNARGQYSVVMPGGLKLAISRSYHDAVMARLRTEGTA